MPTVTYNSQVLPNVYGKFSFKEDEKNLNFSCQFIVLESTSANLVSTCQTIEDKLTEINKDFVLVLDATTEFNLSHSGNTGFLARPTLSKIANNFATETSRPYSFSITIGLPFPQTPYNFRREASFSVSFSPARRRTVNFNVLYTAGGSDSALTKYNAGTGGKAWALTILSALGGNYELVSENFNEEQEEKILNATIIYKEVIAKQDTASINNVNIVDPTCNYSVNYAQEIGVSWTGGYQQVIPATTVTINYSMSVDFELTPDDADVEDIYQDTVKPWVIAHAFDVLGLADYSSVTSNSNYIVQSETKNIDPYNYRFSGSITFLAPKTSSQIMMLSENITTTDSSGIVPVKYWDGLDYTYGTWSMGKVRSLQRVIVISKLNSEPNEPRRIPPEGRGFWIRLNISKKETIKDLGVASKDGNLLKETTLFSTTFFESYQFIIPIAITKNINIRSSERVFE